jgi:O-antigen biosynthesis protein
LKRLIVVSKNIAQIIIRAKKNGELLQRIKDVARLFRSMGINAIGHLFKRALVVNDQSNYNNWIIDKEPAILKDIAYIDKIPVYFSIIVPTYNTKAKHLVDCIESVISQNYPYWELCIADDASTSSEVRAVLNTYSLKDKRINVIYCSENGHISRASNAALSLAKFEWIALLDHDDVLAPFALKTIANCINTTPNVDFIYTDKDMLSETGTQRFAPLLKPQWSPEMLYSVNYLTHFNVMRTSIVRAVGGFHSETDGAQDWDIFFRVTEKSKVITHVPGIMYHWRTHENSTASGIDAKPYALAAQEKSINNHLSRIRIDAKIENHSGSGYRVRWNKQADSFVIAVTQGINAQNSASCLAMLRKQYQTSPQISFFATEEHIDFVKDTLVSWNLDAIISSINFVPVVDDIDMIRYIAANISVVGCPVVFLCGNIIAMLPETLPDLASWVSQHPSIGFATGIIVDKKDTVIDAGMYYSKSGHCVPFFKNDYLYSYGIFGGPLWHRNISCCSPHLVAIRNEIFIRVATAQNENCSISAFILKCCKETYNKRLRGLVVPCVRAVASDDWIEIPLQLSNTDNSDPYFHPYLADLNPLRLNT